jgi:hypothetical protein
MEAKHATRKATPMPRTSEAFGEEDQDRDDRRQTRRELTLSKPKFKQTTPPKRQGGNSVSFNGLHRRRKKRVQW